MLVSALLMALLCPPKRAAAALVATHLNFSHGVSRKCTHARGTLGDRPGALLLYANWGEVTETEASSASGGFCSFVAPAVAGEGNSYDVAVSALNFQSQMGKYEGRNGLAFNWVSPCHYDFVYFRLYRAGGGFYWGSVRACQINISGHGVVHTLGGSWYDMKVRASPSEAVLYRRRDSDGQWYEVHSRATDDNFNDRLIPRSALMIPNGFDNMAFFDAWYILTDAASATTTTTACASTTRHGLAARLTSSVTITTKSSSATTTALSSLIPSSTTSWTTTSTVRSVPESLTITTSSTTTATTGTWTTATASPRSPVSSWTSTTASTQSTTSTTTGTQTTITASTDITVASSSSSANLGTTTSVSASTRMQGTFTISSIRSPIVQVAPLSETSTTTQSSASTVSSGTSSTESIPKLTPLFTPTETRTTPTSTTAAPPAPSTSSSSGGGGAASRPWAMVPKPPAAVTSRTTTTSTTTPCWNASATTSTSTSTPSCQTTTTTHCASGGTNSTLESGPASDNKDEPSGSILLGYSVIAAAALLVMCCVGTLLWRTSKCCSGSGNGRGKSRIAVAPNLRDAGLGDPAWTLP